MAKFRLLLILLTGWLFLLFNLARPDLLLGNAEFPLDLSSLVFVCATLVALAVLVLPDLARMRFELAYLVVLAGYLILRLSVFPIESGDPRRVVYLIVMESLSLMFTLVIVRLVSLAVTNFEKAVENIVLRPANLRILSMADGEERINAELFRARRFDRPVGFILLDMSVLNRLSANKRSTLEAVFQKHYFQTRIGQIVEAALFQTDILTWYNENLFVCLPETAYEEALKTAQELHRLVTIRLNLSLPIGIVVFPENGLIYRDLVEAAMRSTGVLAVEDDPGSPSKRGTGLLPKLDVDAIGNPEAQPAKQIKPATAPLRPDTGSLKAQKDTGSLKSPPSASGGARPVTAPLRPVDSASGGAVVAVAKPSNPFERIAEAYRNLYELFPVAEVSNPRGSDRPDDPDFWVNLLPYQSASSRALYRILKRMIDLGLVILSAPAWLPLLGILAFLVYFQDRGPIFFVQERTGEGGKRFKMYKFRTMVPNAEELLKELAAKGMAKLDARGKLAEPLKLQRDPRVTSIGRIMRKTSLDELPQLLNVVKGDMSIVGPRPTSWSVDNYTLMQTERLSVQPGITGLWQCYGRGDTDFNSWVQWDMLYIEKMSLTLDLKLIFRTIEQVMRRRGAR